MNKFPVLERLKVDDYRLYPGTVEDPGIDFTFQAGISLLAGINGLGKTTLITLVFRLLVGPFELPKDDGTGRFGAIARDKVVPWTGKSTYFAQRVADRAKTATAQLWFRVGTVTFTVRRSLSTLKLQECLRDGEAIDIAAADEQGYQAALCEAAEAGQFVDFLTAVKYLTFFNEDRRDILWDEQAQRQFFRILFTSPQEAREWIGAEQLINTADSRARNISASLYQFEQELEAGERLLVNNAGVDARLSAEQAMLDADLRRCEDLEAHAEAAELSLKVLRRDLERTKLTEDSARRAVEQLRFSRLGALFPSLSETAQYVLTQLYVDGRCLACEQQTRSAQLAMESALDGNLCVVCNSPLPEEKSSHVEVAELDAAFSDARERLAAATIQRDTLANDEAAQSEEWRATLRELADVNEAINKRAGDVESLRGQLPPAPENLMKLRSTIADLRQREALEKRKRQGAEATYERLLNKVNTKIEAGTASVSGLFEKLITVFLEENCHLTSQTISDRPSQGGRSFNYPSLRFEMTAAAFEGEQVRSSPDDVSESQREFIDLAFRMALTEAAASDGAMSMVIETPEASLDAIFMSRAAKMFRAFAKAPRNLIVTSNLTSSVMIPALMGPVTENQKLISKRRQKVLNLLSVAAPNAALRRHKGEYEEFLENGLRGINT